MTYCQRLFLLDLFLKSITLKISFIIKIAICIFFIQSCNYKSKSQTINKQQKDSVSTWIDNSYNKKYDTGQKLVLLKKAYDKVLLKDQDSINPTLLSKIAYRFYQLKDTSNFFKSNKKTLELAIKKKDSFNIADAHWSYGSLFIDTEEYGKAYYHYNTAYQHFNKLRKIYQTARMLFSMSFIKARYKDYTGSEVLTFKAIELFKSVDDNLYLYRCYNRLGLIQNDIGDHLQSLAYHDKALYFLKKLENKKNYLATTYNNIGLTYLEKGDYIKAIKYFNKALKKNKTIASYARIKDNRAYAKLKLNDTIGVKKDLFEALKIRDSLKNKADVIASKIRISEYYEYNNDIKNAIKYAIEVNRLAKEILNSGDYLTSLKQLADLEPNKADNYLNEYIRYNDSLISAERKTLNKFTRIEFETDEILETNKILTQQRIYIFGGSIVLILILSLLYFIRVQKAKNEKLFLETEQQKANEQVYLLTLKQQATLEEERRKERNRISQELHDGILGRLFGTRVGLGFLDFEADEQIQEQHETFLEELQDIEKEIREVSHKLNDNFKDPDVNFTTIVTELLESKSQIGDFQFHLNIDENISWKSTDEIIKVNVYRIIQETLQNAIKHAKAKNVTLDFSTEESQLWVQIKDDGVGFNLGKSRKGIGLKNMRSRVEKLNGTLDVQSAVNKGTQIHIKIPLV